MAYCGRCGTRVQDGHSECPECATPLESLDIVSRLVPVPTRRSRGRRLLVASLAVLTLLVTTGFASYRVLFQFTPMELFFAAHGQYLQTTVANMEKEYAASLAAQRRAAQEPSATRLTLSGDFDAPGLGPDEQQVQDLLRKSELTLTALQDPSGDSQVSGLGLKIGGDEAAAAEMAMLGDRLGLRVPVLDPRYVTAENRGLIALFQRLGVTDYTGPDRFLTARDYREAFDFDPQVLSAVLADYGRYLMGAIHEDEVTLESGVEHTTPEGPFQLRRLTLTLDEARVKAILKGLGEKVRDDERVMDLIAQMMAGQARLMAATGTVPAEAQAQLEQMQDKEWLKGQFRSGALAWDQAVDSLSLPDGIKVTALIDADLRLVQERVEIAFGAPGSAERAVEFELLLDEWNRPRNATASLAVHVQFVGSPAKEAVDLQAKWETTGIGTMETKRTSTVTLTLREERPDAIQGLSGLVPMRPDHLEFRAEVESVRVREAEPGKDRRTTDFTLHLDPALVGGDMAIQGHIDALATNSPRADRFEQTTDLKFGLKSALPGIPPVEVRLHVDGVIDFAQVNFPVFTDENSLNLNTISPQDWQQFLQQLEQRAQEFMMEKAHLFM